MLVILNGTVAIRKNYIAKCISDKLNGLDDIVVDGYHFNFLKHPFEVYDANSELVYKSGDDKDSGIDSLIVTGNKDTLTQGLTLFEEQQHEILGRYVLGDPGYALGVDVSVDNEYTAAYARFVAEYNEVKDKRQYKVITGYFTPHFIDQIANEITEEVKVINITRHPNIAYLLDDSYMQVTDDLFEGLNHVGDDFIESIFNNMLLLNHPLVTTIKFEDIMSTGKITIDGVVIDLAGFASGDNIVTNFEKRHILPSISNNKKSELSAVTSKLSNLHSLADVFPNEVSTTTLINMLPNNIYEELDYDPATTIATG